MSSIKRPVAYRDGSRSCAKIVSIGRCTLDDIERFSTGSWTYVCEQVNYSFILGKLLVCDGEPCRCAASAGVFRCGSGLYRAIKCLLLMFSNFRLLSQTVKVPEVAHKDRPLFIEH